MRRTLLFVGCLGMGATAPSRVHAGTEVEGDGFVGTSAGNWACGPVARVNYGGGGARVRVAEERAPLGGSGFVGEVAGAADSEANHFIRCGGDACESDERVMPKARVMGAGHARFGYQWRVVGVEGGADVFESWKNNTDTAPTAYAIPDLQLSFRHEDRFKGIVGFGAPTVATLARPGLYLGARVPVSIVEFEGYTGVFRVGPSNSAGFRADLATLLPLTPGVKMRLGASGSEWSGAAGVEGSAGVSIDL
jgi:hypothetical protein